MRNRSSDRTVSGSVFVALSVLMTAVSFSAFAGQNSASKTQPPALKPKAVSPPPNKSDTGKSGFKTNPKKAAATPKKESDNEKYHNVTVEMDNAESFKNVSTGTNFIYKEMEENLVITGKQAKYNDKTFVMDLSGNIVLDDVKHHVTGDKAHIDDSQNSKLAVFTGNVVIVLKPKTDLPADATDSAKQRGKGATITCDKVEDYYKKEFVILTGHFTAKQLITQDDGTIVERTMTADHAEYDGKLNSLHLFAPVEMTDTLKQELHFDEDVFVGTKEGEERYKTNGKTHGKFRKKQEEEKPAATPPPVG